MKLFVFYIFTTFSCCINVYNQSIKIPTKEKNYAVISGNVATIYIPRRIRIERAVAAIDTTFKYNMALLTQKMREKKVITDNVQTSVTAKVEEEKDTISGNKLLNFHVEYKYEVVKAFLEKQTDDFPLGKYKLLSSNAAKITMQLLKQAVENQLSEYLTSGTKVTIKITGSTDGTPIVGTIPYLGEYGDFTNSEYFLNNNLDELTITKNNGISNNAQIAFLRTYGVRDFIEKYVEQFRVTQNTFQHYAVVAKDRGGQYRRISVEIVIHDAFRNKFLDNTGAAIAQNNTLVKPTVKVSDVDENIPVNPQNNDKTFAVIIGNENYRNEIAVEFAKNDAQTFKKYLTQTIGIPNDHIHIKENATYGDMLNEIEWLNNVTKVFGGETKIIFYYAGHGMPDDASRSAYLLPVDGRSSQTKTAIKVDELYTALSQFPVKQATVFLDACFSGAARDGMLASGRGVKIKPKDESVSGNLVVFTAVSGDQTAHPYAEKYHGLFSYFLIKKLQETKGEVTYKELDDYISKYVGQISVIKGKEQTPKVIVSNDLMSKWEGWKLK